MQRELIVMGKKEVGEQRPKSDGVRSSDRHRKSKNRTGVMGLIYGRIIGRERT